MDGSGGKPVPQRGDGLGAAHRRAAGVPLGEGGAVDGVVQGEVVRARFREGVHSVAAGPGDEVYGPRRGLVHKVDGSVGVLGHRQGLLDRDLLREFGPGPVQVFDADAAVVRMLLGAVGNDGIVFGVDVGKAVEPDHLAHDLQDGVPVGHGGAPVRGVHLDRTDTFGGELFELPRHSLVPLDHRAVQGDVAAGLACQFLLVQHRGQRGLAGVAGDAEVDNGGGAAPEGSGGCCPVVVQGTEPSGYLGDMAVAVHATRNHQLAGGVDAPGGSGDRLGSVHELDDRPAVHHDVHILAAETVDHGAVGNDKVWGVGHRCPPSRKKISGTVRAAGWRAAPS
ncbi:hypothetical protein SRABI128_04707 [Microbacterium sp. Bi128]|nr:hypothetical protein SRABI128_04707 [Microbacterium sp. Bi128]